MNLHQKAIELVREYHGVEASLIEVLRQIDDQKLYREYGAASLFVYATKILGLTESVAWNFITVTRATKKSPLLKQAIQNGEVSVSKARRITSVLTFENQDEWVEKAKTLSQRNLERAVARENPQIAVPERLQFVAESLMKLEFGLSEGELDEIKRLQDLVCQSKQAPVSIKDALMTAVRLHNHRHDPLEKAKRSRKAGRTKQTPLPRARSITKPDSSQARRSYDLPASLAQELIQRDQGRCVGLNPDGTRCENRRWLDFHHIIPRRDGGPDTAENLVTLCRGHHQLIHARTHASTLALPDSSWR